MYTVANRKLEQRPTCLIRYFLTYDLYIQRSSKLEGSCRNKEILFLSFVCRYRLVVTTHFSKASLVKRRRLSTYPDTQNLKTGHPIVATWIRRLFILGCLEQLVYPQQTQDDEHLKDVRLKCSKQTGHEFIERANGWLKTLSLHCTAVID